MELCTSYRKGLILGGRRKDSIILKGRDLHVTEVIPPRSRLSSEREPRGSETRSTVSVRWETLGTVWAWPMRKAVDVGDEGPLWDFSDDLKDRQQVFVERINWPGTMLDLSLTGHVILVESLNNFGPNFLTSIWDKNLDSKLLWIIYVKLLRECLVPRDPSNWVSCAHAHPPHHKMFFDSGNSYTINSLNSGQKFCILTYPSTHLVLLNSSDSESGI